MTDWNSLAERCLAAPAPTADHDEELSGILRDICTALMPRDDYPTVGTLATDAIGIGRTDAAIRLVEHLFPGWGYQVGKPLTARRPCGWYASVFRERQKFEPMHPHPGHFTHDGEGNRRRYANNAALAIMAALCRVMATEEPGTSALAA